MNTPETIISLTRFNVIERLAEKGIKVNSVITSFDAFYKDGKPGQYYDEIVQDLEAKVISDLTIGPLKNHESAAYFENLVYYKGDPESPFNNETSPYLAWETEQEINDQDMENKTYMLEADKAVHPNSQRIVIDDKLAVIERMEQEENLEIIPAYADQEEKAWGDTNYYQNGLTQAQRNIEAREDRQKAEIQRELKM